MKRFSQIIAETVPLIRELFPWDVESLMDTAPELLLLDVREPNEFEALHIRGSLNIPRGILETACEYGYEETEPVLASARDREIVVICRSGNRSALAALSMQVLGYQKVSSLKTGLKGWTDAELPLIDGDGNPVSVDEAEDFFIPRLSPEQLPPKD
jgi:rhodanese-related sulfurtransferase